VVLHDYALYKSTFTLLYFTKHRAVFLSATAELLGEIRVSGLSNGKNREKPHGCMSILCANANEFIASGGLVCGSLFRGQC